MNGVRWGWANRNAEDADALIDALERELQRQRELTEHERRRADALELRVHAAFRLVAWPMPRPKLDLV